MKFNRTKNASRNIIFGLIGKLYSIIVPFCLRTLMIYLLGTQYLGLNSLFGSILSVLNLAELGVGSAIFYSMYKPIAEDDTETICALMALYKKYYTIIGALILVVGGALTPFLPQIIKAGTLPEDVNLYLLYWMNLGATVLSYWLFAYKNCLLGAHQRGDIGSKISMASTTLTYILQILILIFLKNYYLYTFVVIGVGVTNNIVTACIVDRMYPQYKPRGKLPKGETQQINRRVKDLFTAKLGGTITNSVDTIVISSFLGLSVLAVYQNYYFIMNSICGFIGVLFGAVVAGMGNCFVTENEEKNLCIFKQFSFIICFILCVCCCCFIGLYQPFMKIWVGTELMLGFEFVVLFCILFYCLELAMIWATVKDAAGIWHSDRFRPLIGASANLAMNLLLVRYIGLYGIILSTVLSYIFISMPWLIYNLFTQVYKAPLGSYIKDVCMYVVMTVCCCVITHFVCSAIALDGYEGLFIKGVVCVCVPMLLQCMAYRKKREFIEAKSLVIKMTKRG